MDRARADSPAGGSAADEAPPTKPASDGRLLSVRRGFARELLVVVLGVLIALAVGEAAETVRWEVRVGKANSALRSELARNAGVFEERKLVQPCLERRLAQLDVILRTARRSSRLPQIGKFGRPPLRPVQQTAWNMTSSSETLLHLKERDRIALVTIYAQLSGSRDEAIDEQDLWATLGLLENAPGPIASDLLAEASTALAQLKFRNLLGGANAQQLLTSIQQEGVAPSYWMIFGREAGQGELLASVAKYHICRPLQVQEP